MTRTRLGGKHERWQDRGEKKTRTTTSSMAAGRRRRRPLQSPPPEDAHGPPHREAAVDDDGRHPHGRTTPTVAAIPGGTAIPRINPTRGLRTCRALGKSVRRGEGFYPVVLRYSTIAVAWSGREERAWWPLSFHVVKFECATLD
jgi:hypothetical protein